ncbi:MAG: phosphatidate cytidylyltransferase [Rikenellaceae bacterium]
MKNFIVRALSGLILAFILVGGIIYSPLTSFIVLAIIGLGSLMELGKLLQEAGVQTMRIYVFVSALIILALQLINILSIDYIVSLHQALVIILLLFITRCVVELYRKRDFPFESVAHEIFALIYTIVPILILNSIPDFRYVLILFFVVWANDVAAYIVGSLLGKNKLCERISPKKSWEGFIGGLVMGSVMAGVGAWLIDSDDLLTWCAMGFITSLAGVGGDLFESMYKRSISIKDSGNTIPGHGGFLDRFDALFFAAPVFYILLILTGLLN